MRFSLNTNDYSTMECSVSKFEKESDRSELLGEFFYAEAAFYTAFARQIGCDTEQARKMKKIFFSATGRMIDRLLDDGVLERSVEEELQEDIAELSKRMAAAGFSGEEIASMIQLITDVGSVEDVLRCLKEIAGESGADAQGDGSKGGNSR